MITVPPKRSNDPLSLFNFNRNLYRREGSQARSTAPGSGPGLAGVLGFESHPSHLDSKIINRSFFFILLIDTALQYIFPIVVELTATFFRFLAMRVNNPTTGSVFPFLYPTHYRKSSDYPFFSFLWKIRLIIAPFAKMSPKYTSPIARQRSLNRFHFYSLI